MPRFHPALAAWLRTHHGVVTHQRLLDLGLTSGQIRALLRAGELVMVHEGVYRHSMWPDSLAAYLAAACAADPTVVATCGAAARIYGFRRCGRVGAHLLCPGATKRVDCDEHRLHRTLVLPPEHVIERPDGIRVVTPDRAVFDLARHLGDLDLESVIEQGLDRHLFEVTHLRRVGEVLCVRGRPGAVRFARVVGSRPAWRRPADSHPELVLRAALLEVGVSLEPQLAVDLGGGVTVHPDLGDHSCRFYVEIDEPLWHNPREVSARDRRRDRQMRLLGGRVERVLTDEMDRDLPAVVVEIVTAYRQQQAAWSLLDRRDLGS